MIAHSSRPAAYPFPRFAPHMSPDDESEEEEEEEEGESLSGDETEPLPLTPEPNLNPYPDPERRAEAAKKRKYVFFSNNELFVHINLTQKHSMVSAALFVFPV